MTVSSDLGRADYNGNGVTVTFPVPYRFLEDSHLRVIRTVVATGAETVLTLDSIGADGYSATGAGEPSGGEITVITAPTGAPDLQRITILCDPPITQLTDYITNDPFPAETHERALDKLTMICRTLMEKVSRSIKLPESIVGTFATLPSPDPFKPLVWNEDGTGIENGDTNITGDMLLRPNIAAGTDALFKQVGAGAVNRGIVPKLREMVSVLDYAAVGDGVADDTAAFASALAASKDVFVPRGVYRVAGLSPPAGAQIFSDGATIKPIAGTLQPGVLNISADRVMLDGLVFDGDASAMTTTVYAINATAGVRHNIRNCEFTNFTNRVIFLSEGVDGCRVTGNVFRDTGTTSNCNCIEIQSNDTLVSNNSFLEIGNGHCVRVAGSGAGALRTNIVGNHARNTDHVFVTCELNSHGVNIVGNFVDGANAGVKTENDDVNVSEVNIVGNFFQNGEYVTYFNLDTANVMFKDNIVVNCPGGPYFGPNGCCIGNTFIDSGSDANEVIQITAGGICSNNSITNASFDAIRLSGDAVCSGNRIVGTASGFDAIAVTGANNVVTGNYIDTADNGIVISNTTLNSIIENNTFKNLTGAPVFASPATLSSANYRTNRIGYGNTGAAPPSVLTQTISGGTIYVNEGTTHVFVDTEAAAASDDLDNILGGHTGQRIVLSTVSSSRDVNLRSGVGGNIILRLTAGYGTPCALGTLRSSVTLHNQAGSWVELDRAAI